MHKFNKVESYTEILLKSRLVQLILIILIIFTLVQVYEQHQNTKLTIERRNLASVEYYSKETEKNDLAKNLTLLKDEQHIESEIRRYFDVAREGEEIVIILEPPPEEIEIQADNYSYEKYPWFYFWK